MKKLSILILALLFIASCGKKPESAFTADKTDIFLGQAIQFTSTSTNAEYYHWKFGDGTSSRDANPLHVFTKSGNYEVLLHVSNKGGDRWDDYTMPVTVRGYNSSLIGNWAVGGSYLTDNCGGNSQIYTMNISAGQQPDELVVSNFGDYFDVNITGVSPFGAANKIEFSKNDVQSKTGEIFNVSGYFILEGSELQITYTLSPPGVSVCGSVHGTGTGYSY